MTPPVVRHVMSADPSRPRRIASQEIGRLIRLKDAGRFVRPDEQRWMATGREFAVGDQVRAVAGPLEGRLLRVEQIAGRMATVFTEFFGAAGGFVIPLVDLEREG